MTQTPRTKKLASILKLSPLLIVAACSGGGGPSSISPAASIAGGTVQELPANLQSAICQGRAQEAVDALTAEPLVSATDRFYTALALEEAGLGTRARLLYAGVMQTGSKDSVRARCADRVLANGLVVDEAARRLASLSQVLAAMDVNLAPQPRLHDGIAPSGPIRVIDPVKFSGYVPSGRPGAITRPGSQSPLGQWFVHLASYRSMDTAMKNRATVEKKFPPLAGIIDQWELDVGGSLAVRLGVRVSEKADANNLCNAVKSQQEYCAVIDTSQ